jgi:hypothetical protein
MERAIKEVPKEAPKEVPREDEVRDRYTTQARQLAYPHIKQTDEKLPQLPPAIETRRPPFSQPPIVQKLPSATTPTVQPVKQRDYDTVSVASGRTSKNLNLLDNFLKNPI